MLNSMEINIIGKSKLKSNYNCLFGFFLVFRLSLFGYYILYLQNQYICVCIYVCIYIYIYVDK